MNYIRSTYVTGELMGRCSILGQCIPLGYWSRIDSLFGRIYGVYMTSTVHTCIKEKSSYNELSEESREICSFSFK